MKTTICVFCFLCATAAFGQTASVLSNNPQPVILPEHPQHAAQHAMAEESSLLGNSAYSYGKGEQPLSEFATVRVEVPLGDIAREYRKAHAFDRRATKVSESD